MRLRNLKSKRLKLALPATPSVPVPGYARISDGDCLRELAVLGIGLARLGYCQVEKELENGKLVSVLDEFNSGGVTEIHAIYVGQGGLLPARVRAFMDFLASHIKIT
jgi:DNA-binding transcriptional LysR family regulator